MRTLAPTSFSEINAPSATIGSIPEEPECAQIPTSDFLGTFWDTAREKGAVQGYFQKSPEITT
jgi:hypothetical protein